MKLSAKLLLIITIFLSVFTVANGFSIRDIIRDNDTEIHYCQDNDPECSLESGIGIVGNSVDGLVTDEKASTWFQKVVQYILGFLYLVAVALIIYAGFNLMTGVGDEEKSKKSKTMIIYVIIGLAVIFLANSIIGFVVQIFQSGTN